MNKKKTALIVCIAAAAVIGCGAITYAVTRPSGLDTEPMSSEEIISSTASSEKPKITVPDIKPVSKIESKAESKLEIKVEPSEPESEAEPEPVSKAESKTESGIGGAKTEAPAKVTGDGDVYDPITDNYPRLGDTRTNDFGVNCTWTAKTGFNDEPGWLSDNSGGTLVNGTGIATEPGIPVDENGHIIYDPEHDIGAD